jgi:hypothetical protein
LRQHERLTVMVIDMAQNPKVRLCGPSSFIARNDVIDFHSRRPPVGSSLPGRNPAELAAAAIALQNRRSERTRD